MKGTLSGRQGITLIALVVSIIVLLILAGITIATLMSENGILNQAQKAETTTKLAEVDEVVKLAYGAVQINPEMDRTQIMDNVIAELEGQGYSVKIRWGNSNRS